MLTAQRMQYVTESATSGTAAMARAMRDAGEHIVNFAAGEIDTGSPRSAVAAAATAALDERLHHYGPPGGMLELREAVAARMHSSDPSLTAANVLVTTGTKQAIFHAVLSLVDPGDDVLLPAPYWTSYPTMIRLSGANPVEILAGPEKGFKVDIGMLDSAVTARTKLLVFVSPSNPTGAVYTPDEARAIGEWAVDRGIAVLSDEIYEDLCYPPHESRAITDLVPALRENCLRAGGVGKTFAMTGWRIGWLVGPADAIRAATALQSHSTSHPSNVAQAATLAVLRDGEAAWLEDVQAQLQKRRRMMTDGLRAIPGVRCDEPAGAFYAFPSMHAFIGRTIAGRKVTSTLDLTAILLAEARTAVVAGETFGAPGYLRLSYAIAESELTEGLRRLADVLTVE